MKRKIITIIVICLGLVYLSCKNQTNVEYKNRGNITNDISMDEVEEIVAESKRNSDVYVGVWQDINDSNFEIEVIKKYDNVYSVGGMKFTKNYAVDGTMYLSGEYEQGIEVQFLFDNHTQHLLYRHAFDAKEFKKIK